MLCATQQTFGLRGFERVWPQARVSTKLSERMLGERVAAQVDGHQTSSFLLQSWAHNPELRVHGLAVLTVTLFAPEAALRQSGHV